MRVVSCIKLVTLKWNGKNRRNLNTIIIQVTKLAGKKADNIIILNEMKCACNNKNNGLMSKIIKKTNKLD